MLYNSILETIGNTPLIKLEKLKDLLNLKANIYAKVESTNPGRSIKDRAALNMILDYEKKGTINKDTILIEPTSGNTGIGLALICSYLGYKLTICMPESMSEERKKLMRAYGANLVLTNKSLGMSGAIKKANEIHSENPNSIIIGQFENPANPEIHYNTTAREIYDDLNGQVDILVAGIGTGGTISGISKYLKEKNSKTKVIGIEPEDSPVITKGYNGSHKIQGIGAGFIPKNLDLSLVDEIKTISTKEAYIHAKMLPHTEGILIGISGGAALCVALEEAKKIENENKNIVVIFPDSGERYLSTDLFEE